MMNLTGTGGAQGTNHTVGDGDQTLFNFVPSLNHSSVPLAPRCTFCLLLTLLSPFECLYVFVSMSMQLCVCKCLYVYLCVSLCPGPNSGLASALELVRCDSGTTDVF